MKILEKILNIVAPESCITCGKEGLALCDACQSELSYPERCYKCKKPSPMSLTCELCKLHTPLSAVYFASSYEAGAKELVGKIKYGASRSMAAFAGRMLAERLPYLDSYEAIVTYAPTTPARVRERSFDQSQKIARGLSSVKGLTYSPLLYRKTKSHQVGATRLQRQEHMKHAFGIRHTELVKGKTVVIVDDVLTTGSTLESAARELKKAGAKRVIGAVFARAE